MFSADLTGAVLANSDLRGANLTAARLTDADLYGARVSSTATPTRLRFAHVEGADFSYASLRKASLYHAVLRRAKFDAADLSGADMTGADPTFEQLSKAASLDDETLVDAPLVIASCKNLDGSLIVNLSLLTSQSVHKWVVPPPREDDGETVRSGWDKRLRSKPKCD